MEYNYDKCPECGYVNKSRPDVCPSCGCDWAGHRATLRKKQEEERKKQAEEAKNEELNKAYLKAINLFNDGYYKRALTEFTALGDYEESAEFAQKCKNGIYNFLIKLFYGNRFLDNLVKQQEQYEHFQDPFVQECRGQYQTNDFEKIKEVLIENQVYIRNRDGDAQFNKYTEYCDQAKEWFSRYDKQEEEYNSYARTLEHYNNRRYKDALMCFDVMEGYLDADELADNCREAIYQNAVSLFNADSTVDSYTRAIREFEAIPKYKDSAKYIQRAKSNIRSIKQEQAERQKALEAEQIEKNRKDAKVHIAIGAIAPVLCVIFGLILFLNKDKISIISSFGWWCFGWILFTLIALYSFLVISDLRKDYKDVVLYQRKTEERKATSKFIVIVSIICTIVVFICSLQLNFEPTKCVSIVAINKEDTAPGRYYDTDIIFQLTNDSDVKVTYIYGVMEFYDGETKVASSEVYFSGRYLPGEAYKVAVEFHEDNPSLYDVPFENLKITYRIKTMRFNESYDDHKYDGKAIVIKEPS